MAELTMAIDDPLVSAPPEEPVAGAWSIASAASVACGIFLIVPFFAGLAAIALGIVGIRQINQSNPKMRGRRLAMAGMGLGLLNIAGWSGYFTLISVISAPGRIAAHHFMDDLNSANIESAKHQCLGEVREDRLSAASDQVKSWGGVKSVAVLAITNDTLNGVTMGFVRGIVRTPTGDHAFQLKTVSDDHSNW